jgi:branched-chain amino acid transport system ATP-binding protein
VSDDGVLLRTAGLDRWFGGVHAVDAVDLEIEKGSLHAVIGPNGSGKSTLFNLITGNVKPTAGQVWFDGQDVTGLPQHRMVHRGIAKSYQITTVFQSLTVFENVRIGVQSARSPYVFWWPASRLKDVTSAADELLERVGLLDRRNEVAGNLSHGELRNLDLAIALATSPRLLLLDEPTAGMSPAETAAAVQLIGDLRKDLTVVMIEHKMPVILGIADRITVLSFGKKLFEGTPEEVQNHPEVQSIYLSGTGAA